MSWEIRTGDALEQLRQMPDRSVHTVVTSPPYFGLRDYGTGDWDGGDPACEHRGVNGRGGGFQDSRNGLGGGAGYGHVSGSPARGGDPSRCRCGARRLDRQIGLEPTPEDFVEALVTVFAEVRRVLRDDGTVWLNLGDSYSSAPPGNTRPGASERSTLHGVNGVSKRYRETLDAGTGTKRDTSRLPGVKQKDLLGIPWLVAFALRSAGWYLRSEIVWAKPNPMPESVTDRPTCAHEKLFLLSKSDRYYYDAEAIREPDSGHASGNSFVETATGEPRLGHRVSGGLAKGGSADVWTPGGGRNKRNVWTIATAPYKEAHFATFPPKLIEPCVLAGAAPQVCGQCGAPWRRVTERYDTGVRQKMGDGWDTSAGGHGTIHREGRTKGEAGVPVMATRTLGWEATCDHDDGSGRAVVLDPFAGAGTTGVVALRLDRAFVGIELNPAYVEMARQRIRDDAPLLNWGLEVAGA